MTTRRFKRTLMEAFPQDHAEWLEGPTPPTVWSRVMSLTGVILWLGLGIYFWKTWS